MHPDDASDVRSPKTLVAEVAEEKRRPPPRRTESDDEAKARIARLLTETLERRKRCAHEWDGNFCKLCDQPKELKP